MATFIALGSIATASWFERESFSLWAELEDAFKKTWCINLNPLDAIACACSTYQKEMGIFGNKSLNLRNKMVLQRNECANTH